MEWGINDNLKARSFGTKSDYAEKLANLSEKQSEYKQYYPTRADGNVDEWEALSKQQRELYKKTVQEEKVADFQNKKQYYNVLDRQRYEKLQEKLAGDQLKQRELQEMKEKEKQLEQAAVMERDQKNKYLEYMNSNYKASVDFKKEKLKEQRDAEVEEERERLKRIQRDLKEEERRNKQKKENFISEAQEISNYKKMIKDYEEKRKNNEKNEYQKLSEQNFLREVERENNYKKFFKDYDNNMSERISNHMKHVTQAEIEKQTKLDEIEDKNEKEYKDWAAQKERREKEERLRSLKEMSDVNKLAYDKIDREKLSKREMYMKMVEERNKEENEYKEFQKRQAEEVENKRKLYREALEYQKGMKDYSKSQLGVMTQVEKQLNYNDLETFKQKKSEYEGMIPGIHNISSVGSKPLLRVANDDLYQAAKNQPLFTTKELNKSYKDLRTSIKPLENFTKTSLPTNRDKYDPITNPIPFVNQNPYILKEKVSIGGEGASNLINTARRSRRSLLSETAEKNILI